MKTVTGGVIAAEPISLPKAATMLTSFVSSKNGASQDLGAYLRRASAAFSELRSLHVELKSSPLKDTQISSDVTHERNQGRKKKKKKKSEETIEDDDSVVVGKVKEKLKTCEISMEVEVENEKERRKEKKKKRKSEKEMHSVEKTSKKKSKAKEIR